MSSQHRYRIIVRLFNVNFCVHVVGGFLYQALYKEPRTQANNFIEGLFYHRENYFRFGLLFWINYITNFT